MDKVAFLNGCAEVLENIRQNNPIMRVELVAHIDYEQFSKLLRSAKIFVSPLGCAVRQVPPPPPKSTAPCAPLTRLPTRLHMRTPKFVASAMFALGCPAHIYLRRLSILELSLLLIACKQASCLGTAREAAPALECAEWGRTICHVHVLASLNDTLEVQARRVQWKGLRGSHQQGSADQTPGTASAVIP